MWSRGELESTQDMWTISLLSCIHDCTGMGATNLSLSLQFFETQECERISYFRNALWLHVNQLSQSCVQNDEVSHSFCFESENSPFECSATWVLFSKFCQAVVTGMISWVQAFLILAVGKTASKQNMNENVSSALCHQHHTKALTSPWLKKTVVENNETNERQREVTLPNITQDHVSPHVRDSWLNKRPFGFWRIGMLFIFFLQKYEEIRKSLEMCSIEKDIEFFVNLRKTGSSAPGKSSVQPPEAALTCFYSSSLCCAHQHQFGCKNHWFCNILLSFSGMQHQPLEIISTFWNTGVPIKHSPTEIGGRGGRTAECFCWQVTN